MATLTEVIRKQRQRGQGALGALTSAIGQKTLESIDPRRMLNQRGILTALFPSLKAYRAGGATESKVSSVSSALSASSAPLLQEMILKLDNLSSISKITARNSQALPSMSRDMNIMRQNVVKLVKLQGGQAANRVDAFFARASEREKMTEAQLIAAKQRPTPTSTTPTKEKDGSGLLGMLGAILSISTVIAGLTKVITSIPSLIVQGLSTLPNLISAGLSGLASLLKGGLKIGFDLAKGVANIAGPGIKSAGASILNIIRAAAGFLMSGPGLAILGVGGVAALLGYLLTSDKTKYGDTEKSGSTMDMEMGGDPTDVSGAADASAPIPSGGYADVANEEALARVRARNASTSPTPSSSTPSQTSPKVIPSVPADELGGINYSSYAQTIGQRESNGDYKAVNSKGYLGKYQFGAMALEDMGLIKRGASKQGQKGLDDPSNWTIPGGKEAFLNDPSLQESTMVRYTKQNFNSLKRLGLINAETTADKVAGLLASAHLVGPGGAAAMMRGESRKDAYGTSAESYFKLGSASQGNVQVASKSSSTQLAQASNENASLSTAPAFGAQAGNVVYNDNKVISSGGGSSAVVSIDKATPYDKNFYNGILKTYSI